MAISTWLAIFFAGTTFGAALYIDKLWSNAATDKRNYSWLSAHYQDAKNERDAYKCDRDIADEKLRSLQRESRECKKFTESILEATEEVCNARSDFVTSLNVLTMKIIAVENMAIEKVKPLSEFNAEQRKRFEELKRRGDEPVSVDANEQANDKPSDTFLKA